MKYTCSLCKASEIQLWRLATPQTEPCEPQQLMCAECARNKFKNLRFVNDLSGYHLRDWIANQPIIVHQVMPAVPTPPQQYNKEIEVNILFSGIFHLSNNPKYNWWKRLPAKRTPSKKHVSSR